MTKTDTRNNPEDMATFLRTRVLAVFERLDVLDEIAEATRTDSYISTRVVRNLLTGLDARIGGVQ